MARKKNSAALEAARAEYQLRNAPAPAVVASSQNSGGPEKFIEVEVRGTRRRIPARVLDLPRDQQKAFYDDLEAAEGKEANRSEFDNLMMSTMGMVEKIGQRVARVEQDQERSWGALDQLAQHVEQQDLSIEVQKGEAIKEAQAEMGQMVAMTAGYSARLQSDADRFRVEADNLATGLANTQQQIDVARDQTLGTLKSTRAGADAAKKDLEIKIAGLQSEIAAGRREAAELRNEVSDLRRSNRAMDDRQQLYSDVVSAGVTAMQNEFFTNPAFSDYRAAMGLNVRTCQVMADMNEKFFAQGAITEAQHEEMNQAIYAMQSLIERVKGRTDMPGTDESGDPKLQPVPSDNSGFYG